MSPQHSAVLPSDEELARGLADGDESCLTVAYQRWSALVHALAWRSLGDAREAEDVTQQVFLGVWRGRRTFRPSAAPSAAGSSASPGAGSPTRCPPGPAGSLS